MKQDEDKLSYIDDFQEILQSEVYVDLERLRILAKHGIPNQLRSEVWKYLLGVQQADRSKELSSCKARREEYEQMDKEDIEIAKRIRGEVLRYQRRVPDILQEKEYVNSFVNIILAYLNSNRDVEYSPSLVSLCAPFIYVMDTECDAYFCFERLMQALEDYNASFSLKEQVAYFMTLFRCSLPELCNYFEDEEVDIHEWSTSWLQNLLSKEMRFDNLVRLWDCYFAMSDPFAFHPFVCLSILLSVKEAVEDLEQSEIRTMLHRLPLLNMDMVIICPYHDLYL
ncbi:RabGAP/TBC [Rhizopus microsporus ATCC 52813]|uniref:RabGAP/TBC n=1 Tax=Rhizopus microsporus ATCC 52813 TaxID=1340429 RepID=A0A2G4T0Q5_RHIZD|nr:RabGAP/TBC [Rhizopus microsporus ATCC 52813]PHZ14603.1 RabGAP/TBC [Rhizopus microsporus ATCC 52813]